MIYHFPLQLAGILAGAFLLFISLPGLIMPGAVGNWLTRFPRSTVLGVVLLTLAFIWSLWLLATMEMGEFTAFRRPLLIGLPIGYLLVLKFVNEFLAVRALGILLLLAAEPLLEAAFLRYESSRLLVTVFAYLLIIAGLFWVTMPYLLRDQINWMTRTVARQRVISALGVIYGGAILACALTRY